MIQMKNYVSGLNNHRISAGLFLHCSFNAYESNLLRFVIPSAPRLRRANLNSYSAVHALVSLILHVNFVQFFYLLTRSYKSMRVEWIKRLLLKRKTRVRFSVESNQRLKKFVSTASLLDVQQLNNQCEAFTVCGGHVAA